MKLEIFVDNVLTNNNKPCTSEDVKKVCDYICNRAKEEAGSANSVCIEDEVIKQWVLEYNFTNDSSENNKEASEEVVTDEKEEVKEEPKSTYKPIEFKPRKVKEEKSEWSWGKQTSLFQ